MGATAATSLILHPGCFVTQYWDWEPGRQGTVEQWGDTAELLDHVGAESLLSEFKGFVYGLDRIGIKGFYWFNTYVVGSYSCLENVC